MLVNVGTPIGRFKLSRKMVWLVVAMVVGLVVGNVNCVEGREASEERRAPLSRELAFQEAELSPKKDGDSLKTSYFFNNFHSFCNGLWADVQRHLLQTYEYLCQEAQQWIEGCLGEELGFGVGS